MRLNILTMWRYVLWYVLFDMFRNECFCLHGWRAIYPGNECVMFFRNVGILNQTTQRQFPEDSHHDRSKRIFKKRLIRLSIHKWQKNKIIPSHTNIKHKKISRWVLRNWCSSEWLGSFFELFSILPFRLYFQRSWLNVWCLEAELNSIKGTRYGMF